VTTKKKNFLSKKLLLIPLVLIVVSTFFIITKARAQKQVIDDFPIWILEGDVAVYREMEISPGKVKKTVFLDVPEGEKNIKIYEAIPKEITQSASSLKFRPIFKDNLV